MKKVKIAIVDPNAYGGHNDFCRGLAVILSGEDSVIAYINREAESDNSNSYDHIAVGYPDESYRHKIKSYINIYKKIKIFAKKGYDIHFQDITPYMIPVVIFLLLMPKNEKKYYYTLHNIIPHSKSIKSFIEYKIVYSLLRLKVFKKVFYHFEFIKPNDKLAVENIPLSVRKKMVFVPHHMFHRDIGGKTNRLSVDKNGPIIILFFGAVRRNKGLLEFFSLLNEVAAETQGIKFIVAGEFSEYSKSDLEEIIGRSPHKIEIQIEDRFVEDWEKEEMFDAAHYILQPYLDDFLAQSGVVIDAYEYKKPLIVSTNPSLKYLVSHEKTGYIYTRESLKQLLESDVYGQEQYEHFVDNIYSVLKNKYSDEQIRKVYMDQYRKSSL